MLGLGTLGYRTLQGSSGYHLVMTNIAMEAMALIEIDGLPFLKMGSFHGELLNNQMVNYNNSLTLK